MDDIRFLIFSRRALPGHRRPSGGSAIGITPLALRDADHRLIRERLGVVLERMALELRGVACLGLEEVPPLPETFRCGTPLRACRKSFTLSLHSSSRRTAWNSSVDRIARSRRLLTVSSCGASSNLRAW